MFSEHAGTLDGRTVLVVANHTSWWDGFLIYLLRAQLGSKKPIYVVMLESELKKQRWLRRIGCVGIVPGKSTSIVRSFNNITEACLENPGSWVVFFPQGKIGPSWDRSLRFERGVELLLRLLAENPKGSKDAAKVGVTLLPVALHIEPLAAARPTAFVLAGEPVHVESTLAAHLVESLVQNELDRILDHVKTHGEKAQEVWTAQGGVISDQ